MPEKPTQKQVVGKYAGNLNYLNKPHFFRRFRLYLFLLAVLGSIGGVLGFRYWGSQAWFSSGPISQNHASFAKNCEVCHVGAEWDVVTAAANSKPQRAEQMARLGRLRETLTEASLTPWEQLRVKILGAVQPARLETLTAHALETSSLAKMDAACMKCHPAQKLHAPQAKSLALGPYLHRTRLVYSGGCANCHREHVSPASMALPGDEGCATCHNDAERLETKLRVISFPGAPPRRPAAVVLEEDVHYFVAQPKKDPRLPLFDSFAGAHPVFSYERPDVADPGTLKFNHRRHFEIEVSPAYGHRLDCQDCHLPAKTGAYMERVTFKENCAKCHAMKLDPSMKEFLIPHGEPDIIHTFVTDLGTRIRNYAQSVERINTQAGLAEYLQDKTRHLKENMGFKNEEDLERAIFYTGFPATGSERMAPKTNSNQLIIPCAKCHVVTPDPTDAARPPKVAPTAICDRWLVHGPFNHAAHTHVNCRECHDSPKNSLAAASKSSETSDILMPRKEMCAECHRALELDKVRPLPNGLSAEGAATAMAIKQRHEGGVKSDCHSCHKFHAPPEAAQFLSRLPGGDAQEPPRALLKPVGE